MRYLKPIIRTFTITLLLPLGALFLASAVAADRNTAKDQKPDPMNVVQDLERALGVKPGWPWVRYTAPYTEALLKQVIQAAQNPDTHVTKAVWNIFYRLAGTWDIPKPQAESVLFPFLKETEAKGGEIATMAQRVRWRLELKQGVVESRRKMLQEAIQTPDPNLQQFTDALELVQQEDAAWTDKMLSDQLAAQAIRPDAKELLFITLREMSLRKDLKKLGDDGKRLKFLEKAISDPEFQGPYYQMFIMGEIVRIGGKPAKEFLEAFQKDEKTSMPFRMMASTAATCISDEKH